MLGIIACKKLDESKDIKEIRQNYLTKDDFIREISNLSRKIDRLLDIQLKQSKEG